MGILVKNIKRIPGFLNDKDGSIRKKTLRSGFWVGLTSMWTNSLSFVRSIILARLLTPEIFGLWSLCGIVMRSIEIFTETGFNAAIVHRQKDPREAIDTAFTLMILRSFLLYVLVFSISPFVSSFYEKPILESIIKVTAISFILNGFRNLSTLTLYKELDLKRISYFEQTTALCGFITIVSFAYYFRNIWALVYGSVISAALGTLISYIIITERPRISFNFEIAKELFKYGRFITGTTIVVFITTEIDNSLVGKVLGMEQLGYYSMCYTLANLPATHITSIVSRVMFPSYSKLQGDLKTLKEIYLKVLKLVATFAIPSAMGIAILSKEIIITIYGEKWLPAVGALQVLCIFGAIRSIASTTGPIFNAMGKPKIVLYIVSGKLTAIAILLYPLTKLYGIIGTSFAVTIPMAIEQIFLWYIVRNIIKVDFLTMAKQLSIPIYGSMAMSIFLFFVSHTTSNFSFYALSLKIFTGAAIYFGVYSILNHQEIRDIITSFQKQEL